MLEPAVITLRLLQYLGAMILLGSSLFFLYALPRAEPAAAAGAPWTRRLLVAAAALLAVSAIFGLIAQTSVLAGSLTEGVKVEALSAVVTGMALGKAAVARATAATLALLGLLVLRPGATSWIFAATLGAIATASFAWTGHAGATEGPDAQVHLLADILHGLAAAVWIGALVAFVGLLRARPTTKQAVAQLHRALHGFAGLGAFLVAALLATGLVNSWFLVGPDRIEGLWTTAYGRLLVLKVLLFLAMLGLAAANRFRLTPALGAVLTKADGQIEALAALKRSVAIEAGMGIAVLALVAWFGTLAPPSAL